MAHRWKAGVTRTRLVGPRIFVGNQGPGIDSTKRSAPVRDDYVEGLQQSS